MDIEITMHDGKVIKENVENYDAIKVSEDLNNVENGNQMIVLGKSVISKHTIRMVRPTDTTQEI